jgi:hypothetical protein
MNKRFIAVVGCSSFGHWGAGKTMTEAKKNLLKHAGKTQFKELESTLKYIRFTSELPFAPPNRKANKNEADCWIGQTGCVYAIRCKREDMQ